MTTPFELEQKLLSKGYKVIGGVDEVGRGPLAGPVVCACVTLPLDNIIEGVNDSKKLSAKMREFLSQQIKERATEIAIAQVDNAEIDQINILNATKKAMAQCIDSIGTPLDVVLVDAVKLKNTKYATLDFVKGDERSYLIGASSIIAKVFRDKLMDEYDRIYPQYGFAHNKGYGTKEHIEAIEKYGLCPIHRRSFTKNYIK